LSDYITLTGGNFDQEVLKSQVPVLVDFWAAWCGPCRMVGPVIEQLAKEYAGRVKVGKVNVDEESDLASRYSIVTIPTLMVFKDGNIANQAVGALPKHNIEALFKDLIA